MKPGRHALAKSAAIAEYRAQMNRAWDAGHSAWITGANLGSLPTAAIVIMTTRLKARLDQAEKAAVSE